MDKNKYTVKIQPARVGFISSVGKKTLLYIPGDTEEFWMGWSPEPTYWRPTEAWAIRRAARKQRRLIAQDHRVCQKREVVV